MKKMIVHLAYTTIIIEDLEEVWIQPASLQPTWLLCYKDAKYKSKVLYRCPNKLLLKIAGMKLLTAYVNNKKEIKI